MGLFSRLFGSKRPTLRTTESPASAKKPPEQHQPVSDPTKGYPPAESQSISAVKLPANSGEAITDITRGKNLVDGKQTWELAETNKDDLECMKRCCDAEVETMKSVGCVAAPYYFERVAILSRKAKDYQQEVEICERYIKMVEAYYRQHGSQGIADVRKGPRYRKIVERLPKARELLMKQMLKD